MRVVAALVVLLVAATAWATIDSYTDILRVARWGSGAADPIIIESTSYSPEADGANTALWWDIEQPAGVHQAMIANPYTKAPKIKMSPKATMTRESIEKLTARLAELATRKPALSRAARWKELASDGVVELERKRCPQGIRLKFGANRIMLWSGKTGYDLGAVAVKNMPCDDVKWGPRNEDPLACFAQPDGYLVRVQLRHGCEGDTFRDSVHAVALP